MDKQLVEKETYNLEIRLTEEFDSPQIEAYSKINGLNKFLDWYFATKSFEKSGRLYETLGVKWFRKYVPNGGSWWSKKFGYSFISGRKKENLENFVKLTKSLEGVHTFFLPIYTSYSVYHLSSGHYEKAAISTLLNIIINVYPIMSNRYNRNRVLPLIEKLEKKELKIKNK